MNRAVNHNERFPCARNGQPAADPEADAVRARCPKDQGWHEDEPPLLVHARASGVAGVDRRVDLHVLLEDDTWFQQLVALVRRTTPE